MGKVQTYLSQVGSSGTTGGALISHPASIARTGEEQVYGAVNNIAEIAQDMMMKRAKLNDSISDAKTVQIMKQAELEYQGKIEQDGDTNNYQTYWNDAIAKAKNQISQLRYITSDGKRKNDIETGFWAESFATTSKVEALKQQSRDALAATEAAYMTSIETDTGSPEAAQKIAIAREAFSKALDASVSPDRKQAILEQADVKANEISNKLQEEQLISSTFEAAVATGSKQAGYDFTDKVGMSAEQRREVNNKIKDYWEELEKVKKQTELETYEDFSKKLAAGTFTGDDINFSKISEPEKKVWNGILEGYRKDPPPVSSYDGINVITRIISDVANQKRGKAESLTRLAEERYVNQTITDADYKFALNKINNPYPVHVMQTINGVLDSSKVALEEQGWGLFSDYIDRGEKKEYTEKTQGFLNWVESESKDGKYPDGEAMYKKMRELGVSVKTPKDLPKRPRVVPKASENIYVTTQEQADKLASGTEYYDAILGVWRRRK